ncbi:hypothetical protein [Candidatus Poriferisodalis sp.]|uniref:hypothetical protein n=1 Tax=Candidatus Poriferisodalis sp. TaxID=3101277 RepID=UPI003B021E25
MKITWMRTGADGQTTFEDLEVATRQGERGAETGVLPMAGVIFRAEQPTLDLGFHNAPRRQLVIPLDAEVEVEAGDGSVRRIGPGEVLLADDLTGQGHKSRFRPAGASMLFGVLAGGADPPLGAPEGDGARADSTPTPQTREEQPSWARQR